MSKYLLTDVYPYTPGKMDCLVVVSHDSVVMPDQVVLLQPYPQADFFKEDDVIYRTVNIMPEDIPQGIVADEISAESFAAINNPNPNNLPLPTDAELSKGVAIEKRNSQPWRGDKRAGNLREGTLTQSDWSKSMMSKSGRSEEGDEDED